MKVIIPCAGFGTRVGSPLAKELLPSKVDGQPLIHFIIKEAVKRSWDIHIITRAEKIPLIDYVQQFPKTFVQIVEPTKEWPHSILESETYWDEHNLLILPDTFFSPLGILDDIESLICCYEAVYGIIEKNSYNTWGVVDTEAKNLKIIEKPSAKMINKMHRAWGMIAFQRHVGTEIFRAHLESTFDHQEKSLPIKSKYLPLEVFEDLTRS